MEIQLNKEKLTAGSQDKVGARDDGKWGPCDIIKKTFEIYRGQACTFSWIQVAIVFPCTILWLLNQYYVKKLVHDFWPSPPCSSPCPPPGQCSFGDGPDPCQWKEVIAFIALSVVGFVYWINVVGSLFFSVGSAYAGKTICFKDVIAALPGLWKGLTVTGLWGFLFFSIVLVIIFLLGFSLVTFTSVLPLPIACLLTVTVSSILLFFVITATQTSNGVTVFDQIFGLPAFSKALELLKCKWCVALGVAIIFFIPETILVVIVNSAKWACGGAWAKYVFLGILANLLSVAVQLNVMASALLYLSAKQIHNESISVEHFSFSQNQFESGYQRIGV